MSILDKLKNKAQQAKGQGKKEAGRESGDPYLEAEGRTFLATSITPALRHQVRDSQDHDRDGRQEHEEAQEAIARKVPADQLVERVGEELEEEDLPGVPGRARVPREDQHVGLVEEVQESAEEEGMQHQQPGCP